MIELLTEIPRKLSEIEAELNQEDKHVTFYEQYSKKNKSITADTMSEVDKCDLAIALILKDAPDLEFDEVSKAIYGIRNLLEENNADQLSDLMEMLEEFEKNYHSELDNIEMLLLNNNKLSLLDVFKPENAKSTLAHNIMVIANSLDVSKEEIINFMGLINKEIHATMQAMVIVYVINKINQDRQYHKKQCQKVFDEYGMKIKGKERKKLVDSQLESEWDIDGILDTIRKVMAYGKEKVNAEKQKKFALKQAKNNYTELMNLICSLPEKGEIKNIQSIINKVPDESIRLKILKLIYMHNQAIYDNIQQEYERLSANDASHYQILLAKYGISPETYDVGTIMNNNIEDVDYILQQMQKLNNLPKNIVINILQKSTKETVGNIVGLVERGIINMDFILKNSSVFNPSSELYENFMRNLAFLQGKKINPNYFSSSQNIFVISPTTLKENFQILENYELMSSMRNGINCEFLAKAELQTAIDTLLELGYEKNLEENLELLNYKDKFDRLRLMKELNIPLTTTEEIIAVLTNDKPIVPYSEIGNYIYNAVEHNLPTKITILDEPKKKVADLMKLNEYSNTSRTYSFDGVLISKNKVHRNLSAIAATGKQSDRLLYGIIKGSTLTDEEISKIKQSIMPMQK